MKNKFLKRLVALTLAGCLALGDIPAAAFASEQEIMTESSAAEGTAEQTATELSTELTTEATTESAAESKAEPPTEAATETTAEATTEPASEPETELTTETVAEYAAEAADELDMSSVETIPLLSEKVQAVQKMIDALPSASALNEENTEAAYEQTETAYDAYLDLSADEQAQITGAEKFAALFAVFNAQVETLELDEGQYTITIDGNIQNGTVTADKTTADYGELVTLTVVPAERYALESLVVNGVDVTSEVISNSYAFNVSDWNVNVTATFVCTQPAFTVTQNGASTTYTVNTGTTFLSFWGQQNSNYTYSFWIRTRENKTERIASDTAGEVQDGDAYEMVAYVFSGSNYHKLHVYKDLNVNEWNWAAYCEIMQIHSGTLTVYHSVDGKEKSFELTVEKHKLRDFAEGKQWYYNGNALDMSLDMPPMEMSFTARDLYSIITTAATNGTVTAGSTSAVEGAQVRLTLTPKTGYEPEGVTVTDAGGGAITATAGANNTYTFTMPASEVRVTATFKLKEGYHTITVADIENVTPNWTTKVSERNDMVDIGLAVENDYRAATAWLTDTDGTRLDVAIQITVSGDVTYLNFTMPDCDVIVHATTKAANLYSVTLNNTAPGGRIALPGNFDADNVEANSTITLSIYPENEYKLDTLTVNGENVTAQVINNRYTFTMPESDVTVSATFIREYLVYIPYDESRKYLTIRCGEQVSSATCPSLEVVEGDLISVTLDDSEIPDGFVLEGFSITTDVKMTANGSTYTFTMPAKEVGFQARIEEGGYLTLQTQNAATGCSATFKTSNVYQTYNDRDYAYEGRSVAISVTCPTDYTYTVTATAVNGESITITDDGAGTASFTMPASNVSVTVTFAELYTVTVDEAANGAVTADKTFAGEGDSVTLSVTPAEGYGLGSLSVADADGTAVAVTAGEDGKYTFTMPDSNVTVSATFVQLYTVSFGDTGTSSSSTYLSLPGDENQYAEGETVTVNVDQTKLGNGTVLSTIIVRQVVDDDWEDIDTTVNTDGSITFTMPANNVVVQAAVEYTYYATLNTVGGDENCEASFSGVGVNRAYDGRWYMTSGASFFTMSITAGDDYKVGSVLVKDANGTTELTYSSMLGYQYNNNITSDITVTVTFVRVYTVTLSMDDLGILSLPNGDKYAAGETVTINVDETKLPAGNMICLLGVDTETTRMDYTKNAADKTITFTMPGQDVTAYYQLDSGYYISLNTVGAGEGCTVAFNAETASPTFFGDRYYAKEGVGTVSVNITCAEGYTYTITAAKEDGTPVSVKDMKESLRAAFTMPESDVTITVTFSRVYQVSKNDPFNGTVLLSKSEAIECDEVTVTLAPADCYTLKTLTVDGADVTAQVVNNVYTFNMPSHNVAVNVEFDVIAYSIQGATGAEGKTKVGDTLTVTPYSEEYIMWSIGESGSYPYAYGQTMTVKEEYAGKTITCKIYESMNFSPNGSGGSHVDYPVATLTVQVESNAPSYIITIPSSVSLNDAQGMIITASDVQNLADGQNINIAVTSTNGCKLKNDDNEISYSFAQSLNFVENGSQNLALTIGDTTGKPAGTYTDTLNFSVSLTDAVAGK